MNRMLLRRALLVHGHGSSTSGGSKRSRFMSSSSSMTSVGRMASRRLYRILQRQCVEFRKTLPQHPCGETMFLLQPPLNPLQSGSHRILSVKTASPEENSSKEGIRDLLVLFRDWNEDSGEEDALDWYRLMGQATDSQTSDNLDISEATDIYSEFTDEPTLWSTVSSVQTAIRHAFRHAQLSEANETQERQLLNKYAIRALKTLMQQSEMWRLSSVSYEKDIRVVATSKHVGNSHMGSRRMRGSPELKNRFHYRIRIENLSDQATVQLLGRYWHITDINDDNASSEEDEEEDRSFTVDAPNSGAVGQLPVLRPGDAFEYMSGCELVHPRGVMKGFFFLAPVPEDTPSSTLDTKVEAFHSPERFHVTVNPFPLEAVVSSSAPAARS